MSMPSGVLGKKTKPACRTGSEGITQADMATTFYKSCNLEWYENAYQYFQIKKYW